MVVRVTLDVVDEASGLIDRSFSRWVPIEVWTPIWIIHSNLADQPSLAVSQTDVDETLRCIELSRCEVHSDRCCVGYQGSNERFVHGLGEVDVGLPCLEGEGVSLQPILERDIECLAELRPLRCVIVEIDESWEQVSTAPESVERTSFDEAFADDRPGRCLGLHDLLDGSGFVDDKARPLPDA